jgi:hypothetical protein
LSKATQWGAASNAPPAVSSRKFPFASCLVQARLLVGPADDDPNKGLDQVVGNLVVMLKMHRLEV